MANSKIRIKQIEPIFLVGRYGTTGSQTGPSDGTYGVFNSADLQDGDLVEDAFDKVVNLLDALVPPASPNLSSMSFNQTGVSGKLSWGLSNIISNYDNHPSIDSNSLYSVGGNSKGLLSDISISGTLADNVGVGPGSPFPSYTPNSFGNGDKGVLKLKLDGVAIHSTTLSTFGSGSDLNVNGSGFILGSASSTVFPSGSEFSNFKYRTGTFILNIADHISNYGYKTIQIEHTIGSSVNSTQIYDYAIDNYTHGLSFRVEALSSLVMSGSRYLSGVEYNTSGFANYSIIVNDVYQNSYSSSNSAISHTTINCSISSSPIPPFVINELDSLSISKNVVVDSSNIRILNSGISADVKVLNTVQSSQTSIGVSNFSILLDTVITGDTDINEPMNNENYRIHNGIESNLSDISGWLSGGGSNYTWSSLNSLVGINTNYNNGLLLYNGSLRYPTNSINSGDFSAIIDGPVGNVNYSISIGERVYYRFFYIPSAQNFDMKIFATNTLFVDSTNIGSLTSNQVSIELLAPSQTTNVSSTEWKDCMVSYTTDYDIGCYSSNYGINIGDITGKSWGLSIGTKSTSNSGDVVILKITAPSTWSGNISQINITRV